jgi:hypothetical protein
MLTAEQGKKLTQMIAMALKRLTNLGELVPAETMQQAA